MAIEGKPGKDGEDRTGKCEEGSTQSKKRKIKGKRDRKLDNKMKPSGTENHSRHRSLFDGLPPPCASPRHPRTEKETEPETQTNRQTHLQEEKQKPQSLHKPTHTCMCTAHPHIRTHSLNEQSSCVQWS